MSRLTPMAALLSFAILGFAAPDAEAQNVHRRALFNPAPQIALQPVAKVVIGGNAVAGFVLSAEPYAAGDGPGVCTGLGRVDAKTADGVPISAFEFIGWQVGESYEIVAFGVVPTENPPRPGSACLGTRFEFERLRLDFGQELLFEKMRDVGAAPWTIRVETWDVQQPQRPPHPRINVSFVVRR